MYANALGQIKGERAGRVMIVFDAFAQQTMAETDLVDP